MWPSHGRTRPTIAAPSITRAAVMLLQPEAPPPHSPPMTTLIPRVHSAALGLLAALVLSASPLVAQDSTWAHNPWGDPSSPLQRLKWTDGGQEGDIGSVAYFTIPAQCRFTDGDGA